MRLLFDTGALIALERRSQRMLELFREAVACRIPMTVPAPVVGEWWRGRSDRRELLLASLVVEPLDVVMARVAGEALAKIRRATLVDAIVMASAARSGAVGYTSDFEDLDRLRSHFPGVRLLGTS